MSGLQGWADLPDGLLHSIVPMLGSSRDLIAFAATCPSWRAAFSSYPSKPALPTLFPPLLLPPDGAVCSPRPLPSGDNLLPKRPCHVTDLANQDTYLCWQIPLFALFGEMNAPLGPLDRFWFRGTSYGHLILSSKESCLLVDVFTGVTVSPPPLPVHEYNEVYFGALTASLASANSHLIVNYGAHNFFWRVGSPSWLRCSPCTGAFNQIVVFKDQVFGLDSDRRLFIVHLVPRISIQEIAVDCDGSMTSKWHLVVVWLVACDDMLLMVGFCEESFPLRYTFKAFLLNLSTEPTKWVKVKKLENWAIFISFDERSQPLCCMNPERWGGRGNCIYCYDRGSAHWITFELDKPLQRDASDVFDFVCSRSIIMQPMWVVPSMLSMCP